MTEIKWQEPPPSPRGSSWDGVAKALRGRPGIWALIAEGRGNRNLADSIRAGRVAGFRPAKSFETTTRPGLDGKFDIYARLMGDEATR